MAKKRTPQASDTLLKDYDSKDPKKHSSERIRLFNELNEICRHKLGAALPMDMQLGAMTQKWELDLLKLDDLLGKKFEEYDNKKCLLNGIECSMKQAVEKLLGERASELVNILK